MKDQNKKKKEKKNREKNKRNRGTHSPAKLPVYFWPALISGRNRKADQKDLASIQQ